MDGIKYCLNGKDIACLKSQDANVHATDTNSSLNMCNLNPENVKQL